jgi:hypothetical protein
VGELRAKAELDPDALSHDECLEYVNALPNAIRTNRSISARSVEVALEDGSINVHWMANCVVIDLNRAVLALGSMGKLVQAGRVVEAMLLYNKANQHTFAMFFKACLICRRPEASFKGWRRWAQVRAPDQLHLHITATIQPCLCAGRFVNPTMPLVNSSPSIYVPDPYMWLVLVKIHLPNGVPQERLAAEHGCHQVPILTRSSFHSYS